MQVQLTSLVALALLSGFLSGGSLFLPFGAFVGPGFLFGLLVLLPLARSIKATGECTVLSVIGSVFGYYFAVMLFMQAHWLAIVAGAVGAFCATGPLLLNRKFSAASSAACVIPTGAIAGCVGGLLIRYLPSDNFWWPFKMTSVMLIWQFSVAVSLAYAIRSQRPLAPATQPTDDVVSFDWSEVPKVN